MSSDTFTKNVFDPDFFSQYNFPQFENVIRAESIEDFFGDISFSDPINQSDGD